MKITNNIKYFSVLVGSLFVVIVGIANFINYFIQYHYITNYFSSSFFINPSQEALVAVERTTLLLLILLIISVILAIIAVRMAKGTNKSSTKGRKNGMIILIIGIILFSMGTGDYIGPTLIILGGLSFFIKDGDINIGQI